MIRVLIPTIIPVMMFSFAASASAQDTDTVDKGAKESALCMTCHRFNGQGANIAGDLGSLVNQTREGLKEPLARPMFRLLLQGRLVGGRVVPAVRRPWTGEVYDLSVSPPKAYSPGDFESIGPLPEPGWQHPKEARDYSDADLDMVAQYLGITNNFGEEMRTAQQAEAAWEATDRRIFGEIATWDKCDGRIEARINEVIAKQQESYNLWRTYYEKWTAADKTRLTAKRIDTAQVEKAIGQESTIREKTKAELDKAIHDVDQIQQRKGDTVPGTKLIETLRESLRRSDKRILDVKGTLQRAVDYNTALEQAIKDDEEHIKQLEAASTSVVDIYKGRVRESDEKCQKQNKR